MIIHVANLARRPHRSDAWTSEPREDAAVGLVQPCHQDQRRATRDAVKCRRETRIDLEERFGCALEGLARGVGTIAKGRSDHADRLDQDRIRHGLRVTV